MSAIDPKDLLTQLMGANHAKLREDTLARVQRFALKYPGMLTEDMLLDIANMLMDSYSEGSADAANNFLDVVRLVYGKLDA